MFNNNIGIDLGSDNLHIYIQKEDRFINNKSIVAIDSDTKEVISLGFDASRLIEKEPKNIVIKRPIKKGKIDDIELTIEMLKEIIKKEQIKRKIINPNILISYDKKLNDIEINTLVETLKNYGCKNIYLMDSITLNCIGIGLDIENSNGNMIIDIGYETTKIGVISSNSIVEYKSIELGGNTFNEYLIDYIRRKYKVLIGYSTIEKIKNEYNNKDIEVNGRNLITGLPSKVILETKDINNCVNKLADKLIEEIKNILEIISPELINDISEKGIVITGGGSKLEGLREKIEKEINIPILITKQPQLNIIEGIKEVLQKDIKRATKI